MKVIAVEKQGLMDDLAAWGVAPNYARFFLAKCQEVDGLVALEPFVFNDSMHLTSPYQWFASNAAFWCRAYREAGTAEEQAETLASIRALFYVAGMLGQGSITALIIQWWSATYELHRLPAPNVSPADSLIFRDCSASRFIDITTGQRRH
ncbi:Uncharacterised protein [Serratia marcescens]|uniref:hypothetical protein n=1 Tax=Serratia TaxID=613 RepID=UPI002178DA87|nr:hypothetical protein [Serratia marcescens]CAI1619364.1 Uncharacterised protein [Serratia marcescens]CAI1822311.1 Uncharacterised protein [Serratia marcescens]CAI2041446.1 Uncharacterised protein [Serratia marcescens]